MRFARLWILVVSVGMIITVAPVVSAEITLRVYDNGTNSDDDIARVYVDGQNLGLITSFPGGTNQKIFYLNITTSGTHTLVIEHARDEDAVDLCDEHVGTYGIEFGGGGLSAGNDSTTASRGASVEIDVLSNDIYVSAAATATDSIPCPSESPAPTPPTCECSDARTTYNTTFDISDGAGQIFIDRLTVLPSKGTAEIISGGLLVRYTPEANACGIDTFIYEVDGPNGSTDTATVTVTIPPSSPVAVSDIAQTEESQSILISVLGNDSSAGGGTLSLNTVSVPAHGIATIIGDVVKYTPQLRYEGTDRFSYTIRDVCGATASAWVEVHVQHTNHPPTAHAGSIYQGIVDELLVLDASFSSDPDLGDVLQYRWDLNGDGVPDTEWSRQAQYSVIYSQPLFGQVSVEVRDLYQGQPTGASSLASAMVRITSIQSIQAFVFEDLNANGMMDDGEPGLPGIDVLIANEVMTTQGDGGTSIELKAGSWAVALTPESISQLEGRGFSIENIETSVTLGIQAIETVTFGAVKTSTKLTGLVYADLNDSAAYEEDIDQPLQGLHIILDDGAKTRTDDAGRFFFLAVPFGEHVLWIGEKDETAEQIDEEEILSLIIPLMLDRGGKNEFPILWPWLRTGPDQGFLQVHIEKSGSD